MPYCAVTCQRRVSNNHVPCQSVHHSASYISRRNQSAANRPITLITVKSAASREFHNEAWRLYEDEIDQHAEDHLV
ncbi:predicted protein [Lichtheimia corymbifera JMRC:FSU:9682]|uniref:Uncharacterized protein n=1 Tax=Lichtheimia corymbifera JMRC:FSU:9682 TaxID=1263082 RepID=A0A068S486_9FUNG|nr:predicted protein [Lichtheimia corymbifera JMRC:FSU:9682]